MASRKGITEPVLKSSKGITFLGIDPGVIGGITALFPDGGLQFVFFGKNNIGQVWGWLKKFGLPQVRKMDYVHNTYAVIEEITPRPTRFFQKGQGWKSSILKSTCEIYGSYRELLALLMAAGIPYQTAVPQRWQKDLGVPKKQKEWSDSQWKNVLKNHALKLFPQEKFTLAQADSVLLAYYSKLRWAGKD